MRGRWPWGYGIVLSIIIIIIATGIVQLLSFVLSDYAEKESVYTHTKGNHGYVFYWFS